MATEAELKELDEKFEAFKAELDVLCKKYDAKVAGDYDGSVRIFNNVDSGNREYYL